MSLLEGCKSVVVDSFDGTRPLLDVADFAPGDAQAALNCKFSPGKVRTREGFTLAWSDVGIVLEGYSVSPFYWAYGDPSNPTVKYLAWFDVLNLSLVVRNLGTSTNYVIKSGLSAMLSLTSAVFSSNGKRLYGSVAAQVNGAYPVGGAYVWDGNVAHTMDDCFQRPMKTTEVTLALTQPGAGVCDAGTHYVGVLFQTRAGYWTRPGPVNTSIVLQPQSIASTGTNNIRATLTPASTWPAWIQAVQLIYTTTLNNFQYYLVPGTITPVTAGSATVYTIDFSVADLQIRSIGSQGAGTLADDYFSLLSMDNSNAAPFNVKFQVSWGDRMVWVGNYGGVDTFFPSEKGFPEWISADQHAKQLPGGLPIGAVFVLQGVLYVASSAGGVYGYSDNGLRPVNFAPPRTVDTRISVQGQSLVTVASSGGNAFVMADQGLFAFSGAAFPPLPMSYYQPDLMAAVDRLSVKDLSDQQTVFVQAYGGIYAFNYQNGMTADKVKVSIWTGQLLPVDSPYAVLETVLNASGSTWELWVAGGFAAIAHGGFARMKSARAGDSATTLYSDEIQPSFTVHEFGIDWQYLTSAMPADMEGELYNHLACRVRAMALQSTGSLYIAVKNLDSTISVTPAASPISITSAPGKRYHAFYDLQNEMAAYLFHNSASVRNGIAISEFAHFYNLFAEQR